MIVSTFEVRVLNNLALSQTYFHIKKRDIFFIRLLGKVNRWIKFIKNFQKISQFFFIMYPYKENMINVSEPQQGLQLLHFKKTRLKLALEKTCIWWCKFGTNNCTRNLLFNVTIKSHSLTQTLPS